MVSIAVVSASENIIGQDEELLEDSVSYKGVIVTIKDFYTRFVATVEKGQ